MSGEILVFHKQAGNSDKYWAIDTRQNSDGSYDTWHGRRGTRLRYMTLGGKHWEARVAEKKAKHYLHVPELTINKAAREVVSAQPTEVQPDDVPANLWYQFRDPHFDRSEVQDFLNDTMFSLAKDFRHEAEILVSLPIFKALRQGNKNGGAEMSEGPLGILLLFALRKHFQVDGLMPGADDFIRLADDNSVIMPNDFHAFSDLIVESCVAFLESHHCVRQDGSTDFELVQRKGFQRFASLAATKELAIAMGCMEAPINLLAIASDRRASFF